MPLPDRPNLEYLKKLAMEKLQELPRADARARLADAQLAIARQHGFTSWRALHARLAPPRPAVPPERITELFEAIKRGEEAAVTRLLDVDPALANARDAEGSTPLLSAVDSHRATMIPVLLARGPDPGGVYAHSAHTPLSWAVVAESFDSARALMRAGTISAVAWVRRPRCESC